jgi:hypothetical protein
MNTTAFLKSRVSLLIIAIGLIFAAAASASLEDLTYPIAELGGCESQEACYAFCGESDNYDTCMAFAQEQGLLEDEEIEAYEEAHEALVNGGPGGCSSESECEAFCSDISNMDICLEFAEEHGLMDEEELAEARAVQSAIDAGYSLPGECTDEDSCEDYCSDPANADECLDFAAAAGLMNAEEIEEARAVMDIMAAGGGPGGCTNQSSCEDYCSDNVNFEECTAFAVEAGFMTPEEAAVMMETGGQGPGGCTSEEECAAYCGDDSNMEECIDFAAASGLISEEELETMQTMMDEDFTGPGGCSDPLSCEEYCSDSANIEECGLFFGHAPEDDEYQHDDDDEYNDEDRDDYYDEYDLYYDDDYDDYDDDYYNEGDYADDGIDHDQDFDGPGGCEGEYECGEYCLDPANMVECMDWFEPEEETVTEDDDDDYDELTNTTGGDAVHEEDDYDEDYDDDHDQDADDDLGDPCIGPDGTDFCADSTYPGDEYMNDVEDHDEDHSLLEPDVSLVRSLTRFLGHAIDLLMN